MRNESLLIGPPQQAFASDAPAPLQAEILIENRDLSLLEFFRRVLSEGVDVPQPLLERVKFLAIFSSNLDEFFMIRVPGLKENLDDFSISPDGLTVRDLLKEIRRRVQDMVET